MKPCKSVEDCKNAWKEIPHLAPVVIKMMDEYLIQSMNVFEWGSGGSTLWISRRVSAIHSVEANSHWYDFLSEKIKKEGITNITIDYQPEIFIKLHNKTDRDREKENLDYVKAIEKHHTKFDLIIVDGIVNLRNKCLEKALYYIKPGGRIIFDDMQHPGFQCSKDFLALNNWKISYYDKPNGNLTAWIYR